MTCVNGDWLLFSWFMEYGIGELTADQPQADQPQFLRLRRSAPLPIVAENLFRSVVAR